MPPRDRNGLARAQGPKSQVVAVIENDGPRGRFRRKVRAKLAAWKGAEPGDNLKFLAQPWGQLRLSLEDHRVALARYINEHDVDVLIAGPIVSLGMIGGGTPDEVAAFEAHLQALRDGLKRPLLIILLHHTNQRGQISGHGTGSRHADIRRQHRQRARG